MAALAASLVGAACASEGFPPGGPEDKAPPSLVESNPADRAVNAAPDQAITLRFDETIDDRQLRDLQQLIRVNPDEPEFELLLDEETVRLRPREPMLDGVTYAVTLLPGIRDREGNATIQPRTILFSVGGEQPITLSLVRATILRDTVPVPRGLYRLENQETDFGYTAVADSQGLVQMEAVAYGPYVATAWEERVRPDGWQMDEEPGAQDTFALGPGNRAHQATYRIAVRDTTPPVVFRVETHDDHSVLVAFDDTLSGDLAPPPDSVRLWAAEEDVDELTIPLDSIPLEDVRARRIDIADVRRMSPAGLVVVTAAPLERGAVYRVEVVGVRNRTGVASTAAGGLTFRAEIREPARPPTGPRRVPAEPIPWPPRTPGSPP